jgi:hypothetical protein
MDQIIVDRQIRRRRTRRRGIVALLGAASLLTVGAGSISLAQFTDSDASTWAFTAGTIDISTSPTVLTAVTGMMPGDNATQALTVTNGGSGDLRYAITVAATNPLGTALQLTIKGPDGGVGSSCTLFNGASILAATTLNGATVGNPAQGANAGDRPLLAGTNEVLCLRVRVQLATGNGSQGACSAATFTFDAEQTANN